jgi:hypothetical protein
MRLSQVQLKDCLFIALDCTRNQFIENQIMKTAFLALVGLYRSFFVSMLHVLCDITSNRLSFVFDVYRLQEFRIGLRCAIQQAADIPSVLKALGKAAAPQAQRADDGVWFR